jgi:hypothetical protein
MALVAVTTALCKRRMAETVGGMISGTLSPGPTNRAIVPVFYQLGETLASPVIVPPDPTFTALDDPSPFQKSLTINDFAVIVPPNIVVAGGLLPVFPLPPPTGLVVAEPTLRIRVFADINEAVFSPAKHLNEVGVFIQFGTGLNSPELGVYGTMPAFFKSAGLTVDFTLDVKF